MCPTLWFILIMWPLRGPSGGSAGGNRDVSLRCVRRAAVGGEALLRSKGADIFIAVGAVEQVTVEAVPGLPQVLLDQRHGAVRLRAAGVHTVLRGVHPVRGQQEGGPLLDGGLGPDDALPHGGEVAHTGVSPIACPVRLVLLELLAELLQQLLHP